LIASTVNIDVHEVTDSRRTFVGIAEKCQFVLHAGIAELDYTGSNVNSVGKSD